MAAMNSISAAGLHSAVFVVAVAAMAAGSLTALREKRLSTLLLLWSMGNAGYLLIPVGLALRPANPGSFGEWPFALAAYALAAAGMGVALSATARGNGITVQSLAGLYHRAPWMAAAMLLFLLSLAGMPLTAGFPAKWLILLDAVSAGAYWVAAAAAVSGVIALGSYIGIAVEMYMRAGDETAPVRMTPFAGWVIGLCAAGTVLLGIVPQRFIEWLGALLGSTSGSLLS